MDHSMYAAELFMNGCNCAQAVFVAFCDVTGLEPVKETDGQGGKILKYIMPHLLGNGTGKPDHHQIQQVREKGRNQVKSSHQSCAAENRAKIHPAGTQVDGIDRLTGKLRTVEGEQASGNGQEQRQDHQSTVAAHVPP